MVFFLFAVLLSAADVTSVAAFLTVAFFAATFLTAFFLAAFRGFFQRFLDRAKFFANLSVRGAMAMLRVCLVLRGTATFAARVEPCVAN